MAASSNIPIREISRRSQSFDDPNARRKQVSDAKLLNDSERAELLYDWGGYASAASVRSPFGAILEAALRAPPRNVWRLVAAELEKRGGRAQVDSLLNTIEHEGEATRREVRMALRVMCGRGQVTKYVQPMPRKNQKGDMILVSIEMVKLERWKADAPQTLTREERWARADEELARGWAEIPCKESRSLGRDPDRLTWGDISSSTESVTSTPKITGLDRVVIERVYGSSFHPAYANELTRDVAAVAEYTSIVSDLRVKYGTPTRNATTAEVLRRMLDEAPKDLAALVAWREARASFITAVKQQGRRLVEGAVSALRKAGGR